VKSPLLKILLAFLIMAGCSLYLGSFERKVARKAEEVNLSTWLVRAFNLKELAVGFLWLRFDTDTVYQLANHHRLLVILDAITSIKEDDFDAWSLKNYMRIDLAMKRKDEEMKKRALKDYKLACELNSADWRYYHDAAQIIFRRLKNRELALDYAEKANGLEGHQVKAERLLAMICFELEKFDQSAKVYRQILQNPDAEASEKKVAEAMLKIIEQKTK